jgi:hypothetical protein
MLDPGIEPKRPHVGVPPGFAASQGANILLAMGVALFLMGSAALVIGNTIPAALLIAAGLASVIIAARLGGLAKLTVEVVKVKVAATFDPDTKGAANGPDDSADA